MADPVLLKTCMGGYDGKGQRKVDKVADAEAAFQDLRGDQRELIAEVCYLLSERSLC